MNKRTGTDNTILAVSALLVGAAIAVVYVKVWKTTDAPPPKITFSLINYAGETEAIVPTCTKVRIEQSGDAAEATCWRDNGDEVTLTGGRFYAQPEQ